MTPKKMAAMAATMEVYGGYLRLHTGIDPTSLDE